MDNCYVILVLLNTVLHNLPQRIVCTKGHIHRLVIQFVVLCILHKFVLKDHEFMDMTIPVFSSQKWVSKDSTEYKQVNE